MKLDIEVGDDWIEIGLYFRKLPDGSVSIYASNDEKEYVPVLNFRNDGTLKRIPSEKLSSLGFMVDNENKLIIGDRGRVKAYC